MLLETNKVIGHIAVDPDSEEGRIDTRELGCVLNAKYHRRGIMSEAIGEVIDYLFREEGVEIVWACCFQKNVASKGMIEKCGFHFIKEGTFYSSSLGKEFLSYEYCITKENKQL